MKQFTYAITDPIGIEGGDEDAALAALEAFMKENL